MAVHQNSLNRLTIKTALFLGFSGERRLSVRVRVRARLVLHVPGPDLDVYATAFDPVTHGQASMSELYAPLEAIFRTINESFDQAFVDAVSQYLDLPLFRRNVAAQDFLAQWDGILGYAGVNNFYLYRFEGSLRSQFILSDEDNAFQGIEFESGMDALLAFAATRASFVRCEVAKLTDTGNAAAGCR